MERTIRCECFIYSAANAWISRVESFASPSDNPCPLEAGGSVSLLPK